MTEKELHRLGKIELLAIIRDQEEELERIRVRLEELQQELENKKIGMEQYGSIAEASLQLNGIFQSAQEAADQYVANIRERETAAEQEAARIQSEAEARARDIVSAAEARGTALERASREKADDYWGRLYVILNQYYDSHVGLKQFLEDSGIVITIPKIKEG